MILISSVIHIQFLPSLDILQFLSLILFLQYSTTSSISELKLSWILISPLDVVFILSIFNKNYSELEEKLSNYNTIDNNIVAIRYENLSEIENTTYKVDRMLENKYIYKADKTKAYWS